MDYWNHVLWSDETKINLFCSDGVKRVWRQPGEEHKDKCVLPTVKHGGGSIMVWGCMCPAGTGEQQFIEGTMNANMYCDILKQSMIPSLRRLGRRAVFQHDNNHCCAKEAEGKGDGLAKHVSKPKQYWSCRASSILRGQQIYTVIQAVHLLLSIVEKCHFFSVVTWKDIIKYLQKCEGCTHFCEIL